MPNQYYCGNSSAGGGGGGWTGKQRGIFLGAEHGLEMVKICSEAHNLP